MSLDREKRKKTQAQWYLEKKSDIAAKKRKSWLTRRALHLCWEARRRAARKGIPCDLNDVEIARIQAAIDAGKCEITGSPFDLEGFHVWNAPSLDQIKPGHGYVPGNIRVVCRAMNCAMQEWGEDDVWKMFQYWRETRGPDAPAN